MSVLTGSLRLSSRNTGNVISVRYKMAPLNCLSDEGRFCCCVHSHPVPTVARGTLIQHSQLDLREKSVDILFFLVSSSVIHAEIGPVMAW